MDGAGAPKPPNNDGAGAAVLPNAGAGAGVDPKSPPAVGAGVVDPNRPPDGAGADYSTQRSMVEIRIDVNKNQNINFVDM